MLIIVSVCITQKRVVDFLLVLIELFHQLTRLRCYEQTMVTTVVFENGWVTLSANFTGNGGRPPMTVGVIKLVPGLSRGIVSGILRLSVLTQ